MTRIIITLLITLPASLAIADMTISLDGGVSGLTSNAVIDIDHDSSSVWLGTSGGASVSTNGGDTWTTFGQAAGLPRDEVSALVANDRGIWVASSHSETINEESIPFGNGISLTTDRGLDWTTFTPRQATWPGMLSYDLAAYDSIVYSACFYGGLIRSTDYGQNWENLFPTQLDSVNTDSIDFHNDILESLNNRFFSVKVDTTAFPDTLSIWAGSAAGINRFFFLYNGVDGFNTYPDSIYRIFRYDIPAAWDTFDWYRYSSWDGYVARVSGGSSVEDNDDWLISPVVDFSGASACTLYFRHYYDDNPSINEDSALVMISDDGGEVWAETLAVFTDSVFGDSSSPEDQWIDISSFAAGKNSISVAFRYLKRMRDPADSAGSWSVDNISFIADDAVLMIEDFEGSWGAYGSNPPDDWEIIDIDEQFPGNFVVALGIQKYNDRKTIWAACRPAFSGFMRVAFSHDDGSTWHLADSITQIVDGEIMRAVEAWDFAFSDDTVYVATGWGLYRSQGDYALWSLLSGFVDQQKQTFYQDDAPFYAVDIVDAALWAGGSDGVIRRSDSGEWLVYRSMLDAGDHYAYPSPFSPFNSTRKGTTIHFRPSQDTRATIEIYDINLELVKTVKSGIFRRGGVESDDIIWDGTNGNGGYVANGVYFYRIELDYGEDLWGKVMVLK